jgi:Uma2 family endonuclease
MNYVLMGNAAKKLMTAIEYLEFERNSLEKHEFYNGEIYAMAGAKERHNLIVSNLIISIGSKFKNKPCVVYPSDMRVVIDEYNHYTYPDVTLVCGERKFLDNKNDCLLNPNVIIEVLSDSTEKYDRGKKFEAYRNLISLREYMLVSSEHKKIELFTKTTEGKWLLSENGIEDTIIIPTLDLTLLLSDVYDKVEFEQ